MKNVEKKNAEKKIVQKVPLQSATCIRVYPQSVRSVTRDCAERLSQLPFQGNTNEFPNGDCQIRHNRFSSRNVKNVGEIYLWNSISAAIFKLQSLGCPRNGHCRVH